MMRLKIELKAFLEKNLQNQSFLSRHILKKTMESDFKAWFNLKFRYKDLFRRKFGNGL